MTDRELLELAAKAAGFLNFDYASPESGICVELGSKRGAITSYWNPLTDDGDALRLAVKLQIEVGVEEVAYPIFSTYYNLCFTYDTDPYAATRRAIVRAAAAIGEEMK